MANELSQLPNPDNVPGGVTTGYQRQNINIYAIQTGFDTTEPYDDGNGIITIPAGGIVEVNGIMFKITSPIERQKNNANTAYWVAVYDNGNGTADVVLVDAPGTWNAAKKGCYRTDGARTLNWVSLGNPAGTGAIVFSATNKGRYTTMLSPGWYKVTLESGLGGSINSTYGAGINGGDGGDGANYGTVSAGAGGGGGGGGGGCGGGERSSFDHVETDDVIPGRGGSGGQGGRGLSTTRADGGNMILQQGSDNNMIYQKGGDGRDGANGKDGQGLQTGSDQGHGWTQTIVTKGGEGGAGGITGGGYSGGGGGGGGGGNGGGHGGGGAPGGAGGGGGVPITRAYAFHVFLNMESRRHFIKIGGDGTPGQSGTPGGSATNTIGGVLGGIAGAGGEGGKGGQDGFYQADGAPGGSCVVMSIV